MRKNYPVPLGETDSDFLNQLNDFLNNFEAATGTLASLTVDVDGSINLYYESYPEPLIITHPPKINTPEDNLEFDELLRGYKINEFDSATQNNALPDENSTTI
jgi:hypothetical protein